MAASRSDWDILWVILLAAVCWIVFWYHAAVGTWIQKAWMHKSLIF